MSVAETDAAIDLSLARRRLTRRDLVLYAALGALGLMLLLPFHVVDKAMPVASSSSSQN